MKRGTSIALTALLLAAAYPGGALLFHPDSLRTFPDPTHEANLPPFLVAVALMTAVAVSARGTRRKLLLGALVIGALLVVSWPLQLAALGSHWLALVALAAHAKLAAAFTAAVLLHRTPRAAYARLAALGAMAAALLFADRYRSPYEHWADETLTSLLARGIHYRGAPEDASPDRAAYLARLALAFRGIPYEYGANLSDSGRVDCSSLTRRIYHGIGFNLPRLSGEQWLDPRGERVAGTPEPGDLVFFAGHHGAGPIAHVGISLGGSRFISADPRAGRVIEDTLDTPYWRHRYRGARRFLKEPPVDSKVALRLATS